MLFSGLFEFLRTAMKTRTQKKTTFFFFRNKISHRVSEPMATDGQKNNVTPFSTPCLKPQSAALTRRRSRTPIRYPFGWSLCSSKRLKGAPITLCGLSPSYLSSYRSLHYRYFARFLITREGPLEPQSRFGDKVLEI